MTNPVLPFSTIQLYAGKQLCASDALGRPCRCDRCVAILACRIVVDIRRYAQGGR